MNADRRTKGDNFRDTLLFKGTGEVPIWVQFSPATWLQHGARLADLVGRHTDLPVWRPPNNFDYASLIGNAHRAGVEYLDNWGCLWHCKRDGMEGIISQHPLSDIRRLKNYRAPDPSFYAERENHDWGAFTRRCQDQRAGGSTVMIQGERFFERVHFLRGMTNAFMDMADETPEIQEIIDIVLDYNLRYLKHALEMGSPADIVNFGDDWGCQDRCMIGVETFRRYFKPGYARMYALCRQYGALATQHSDGYTVDLWDEFLEAGLTAFNMQVNCVGIDAIESRLKGRMCIIADVDRQHILPFGKPEEVRAHIAEIVTRLGSPKGGLVLRIDIYPDVPLANIEAVLTAVEDYRNHWVTCASKGSPASLS